MLHLFDDLWLDKIIPKNNDRKESHTWIIIFLAVVFNYAKSKYTHIYRESLVEYLQVYLSSRSPLNDLLAV
jgi:hypothetical protein